MKFCGRTGDCAAIKVVQLIPSIKPLADSVGSYIVLDSYLNTYFADIDGSGKSALVFRADNSIAPKTDKIVPYYSTAVLEGKPGSDVNVKKTNLSADGTIGVQPEHFHYLFLDINGDGIDDVLKFPNAGGYPQLIMNTGTCYLEPVEAVEHTPLIDHKSPEYAFDKGIMNSGLRIMDYNQDGMPEILLFGFDSKIRTEPPKFAFGVLWYKSTYINGHYGLELEPGPYAICPDKENEYYIPSRDFSDPELVFTQILDVNGDGLQDIVSLYGEPGKRSASSLQAARAQRQTS